MNENPFDSLISAYFDGELNDADRQAVDERLADDAAARQELADYGQLSVLLRDLDRSSLPEEFTAQVMQRLERRTLLPQPQTAPRRSLWGWSAMVPLAATAAVLLLMWAAPRRDVDDRLGRQMVSRDGATPGLHENEHYFHEAGNSPTRGEAMGGLGGFGAGRAEKQRSDILAPAPPESPAPAEPSDLAADAPAIVALTAVDQKTKFGFQGKDPQDFEVGSVIEAIEKSPTRVAVVKLWVVDRQEGLDKLQLLLARNDVEADDDMAISNGVVVGNRAADKLVKRALSEGKPAADLQKFDTTLSFEDLDGVSTSDGLVAIYVEAPRQKLAEVLEGLRSDHAFVEVDAQPNKPSQRMAQLGRGTAGEVDARGLKSKPAPTELEQLARNEKKEALGDRSGAGSFRRNSAEPASPKSGVAPPKTPGAAPPMGPILAKAKNLDAQSTDEFDRESKRNLGRRSRYMVIDKPVELRDAVAAAAGDNAEFSKKAEQLKESGASRNEARDPARKAGKNVAEEDAKSVAGPLHVIFLVEQAQPRK
jgi:hypothetical protein